MMEASHGRREDPRVGPVLAVLVAVRQPDDAAPVDHELPGHLPRGVHGCAIRAVALLREALTCLWLAAQEVLGGVEQDLGCRSLEQVVRGVGRPVCYSMMRRR